MTPEFEGLNLVELIDLLEEAPEPPPIAMTPQTPGWIVLGLGVAILAFLTIRWALRRYRADAYRRAALAALDGAGADPAAIATILRRTALSAYPREQVAGLAGVDWLAFLDRTYPGNGFADGPGRIFATAPFRPQGANPDAARLARDWIKTHQGNR